MKTTITIIATVLAASAALADEPTFESLQDEFRQKAISLLSEKDVSAADFHNKIAEIANATFGSHSEVMKKEAASRFKRLPVFPASRLAEFVEHKSWGRFLLPPAETGLAWVTFGWEPEKLADAAKNTVLSRMLGPEEFGRRAFLNSYCPDKVHRLGEGQYPNLVVDSLGDLFVISVEMTEVGVCRPVEVKWMKALSGDLQKIRNLIPAAAAMTLSDMDKLATSPTPPKPSDLESKTLTLMLFSLKGGDDEKAKKEFRYLTERVRQPSQLAMEINRFVKGRGRFRFALGPVTMIHADRITDCTCTVDGDTATGTVSFMVPKLYEGQVNYVAWRREGKWKIEEFIMPLHEIHIAVADNGKWVQK